MEDESKRSNLSDRDKAMSERFEFKKDDENDDDESEDKEERVNEKAVERRTPTRSLFIDRDTGDSSHGPDKPGDEKEKAGLFSGLLRNKDQEDATAASPLDIPKEDQEFDTTQATEFEESNEHDPLIDEFQGVVVERLQAVEQELEVPESPEHTHEVLADAEFLEEVGDRLEEGMGPETAIDDAMEDFYVPQSTDAVEIDLHNRENFEGEFVDDSEVVVEQVPEDEDETVQNQQTSPQPVPQSNTSPNANPNTSSSPPNPNTASSTQNQQTAQQQRQHYYYGGGFGGYGGGGGGGSGGSPNQQPSPQNPNNQPNNPNIVQMNSMYYRNRRTGDILLGGVLGYLLGKRRGRRKTEGELLPVLKKREKTIDGLRYKLEETEARVRSEVAKTARTETIIQKDTEVVVEKIKEYVPSERETIRIVEKQAKPIVNEKKIIEEQQTVFESKLLGIVERDIETIKIEKEYVESPSVATPEFAVAPVELSPKRPIPEAVVAVDKKKDPRSMSMHELLQIAEYIGYDKANLRELYERHRIDAVNLRRVVIEYLNGGNKYEEIMRKSLEAVEMQRELRNETKQDPGGFQSSGIGAVVGGAALGSVLTNAVGNTVAVGVGAGSTKQSSQTPPKQQEPKTLSAGLGVALGVVTGLVILGILLLFSQTN